MRDFQEFIDKKIAVEATDEFMQLCEGKGLLWNSGKKPTEQKPHPYVTFRAIGNDAITGDCLDYFKRKGYEIVPASEFLQQPPTIEIFQSKQTVVCLKKQDNKVVAVGKARCNPEDEFDFDYGAKLAFERMEMDITRRNIVNAGECLARGLKEGIKGAVDALKELSDEMNGIKTLKNGMRIKKQDVYEVGDLVLIKKEWKSSILKPTTMNSMLGNTYEVIEVGTDIGIKEDGVHYELKVRKEGTHWDEYWFVCQSDIKGKVIQ